MSETIQDRATVTTAPEQELTPFIKWCHFRSIKPDFKVTIILDVEYVSKVGLQHIDTKCRPMPITYNIDVERKQAQAIASLPDSITQLLYLL